MGLYKQKAIILILTRLRGSASLPGPSHSFVIVLGVNCQDADTRAYVNQQHWEWVVKATRPLHTVLGVRGVFKKVAFWMAIKPNGIHVEQPLNQTVQFIEFVQLQICHLKKRNRRTQ